MDPIRNDLQWPSIDVFARKISYPLERFMGTTVHIAARIIQHSVRRYQQGLPLTKRFSPAFVQPGSRPSTSVLGPMTRSHLVSYFCGKAAVASVKLDGTNVGIDANDGALYGRRLRLEDDATSYQKTDIQFLRGRQQQVFKFREALGLSEPVTFRLYGELLCNNRFDYDQTPGLHKGFRVFGAVADLSSLSPEDCKYVLQKVTCKHGMAAEIVRHDGQPPLLVMQANDAFRGLLNACSDSSCDASTGSSERETVSELSHGSLVSIVDDTFDWMAGCRGEGLVLTWRWNMGGGEEEEEQSEGFSFVTAKYKTAAEPQGATADVLERVIASVEAFPCQFLLPPGVAASLLPRMLDVSKATVPVDSRAAAVGTAVAKKKQKAEQKALETPDEAEAKRNTANAAAEEALASALTKFDTPAEYFKKAGDGRRLLVDLLVKEMRDDLLAVSFSATDESKVADSEGRDSGRTGTPSEEGLLKAGRRAVEQHVGKSFGAWKKAQKQPNGS
jgi:hypothetical protein